MGIQLPPPQKLGDSSNTMSPGPWPTKRRPDIFLKCQDYRKQLQLQSIRINLVKVTGHDSIYGNELADQHASDMSKMIAYGNISAPSNVTTDEDYNKKASIR